MRRENQTRMVEDSRLLARCDQLHVINFRKGKRQRGMFALQEPNIRKHSCICDQERLWYQDNLVIVMQCSKILWDVSVHYHQTIQSDALSLTFWFIKENR